MLTYEKLIKLDRQIGYCTMIAASPSEEKIRYWNMPLRLITADKLWNKSIAYMGLLALLSFINIFVLIILSIYQKYIQIPVNNTSAIFYLMYFMLINILWIRLNLYLSKDIFFNLSISFKCLLIVKEMIWDTTVLLLECNAHNGNGIPVVFFRFILVQIQTTKWKS